MHSVLGDLLGIDVPIFAFTHCRDVVVEVSKSGGLGVLGSGRFSRHWRWALLVCGSGRNG